MARRQNPLFFLFGSLWRYSKGYHKTVVLFWSLFAICITIDIVCVPLIWASLLNEVQVAGITEKNILFLSAMLAATVAIEVVCWGFHGPARVLETLNAFRARTEYRRHLLQGVMALPLSWHANHHSGDTIDKIEKGTTGLYQFSESTFQIIYGMIRLVGSFLILSYFCPPAGGVVAIALVVSAWVTIRFDRVLIDQYVRINRAENIVSESVFDAVSNISTVIILRVERLVFGAIMRKVEEPYALVKKNALLVELKWFFTSFICAVMTAVAIGAYVYQNYGTEKGLLLGSLYLLIQYLSRIGEQFFQFNTLYGDVLKRSSRVANSEELSTDFCPDNFSNHVLPDKWQRLDIKNLSFSYEDGDAKPHLENISLSIKHGERIAFVGHTGSGKTTMLKVMRDLYHPSALSLSVDGKEIPHGFDGISRAIALVPQSPEIFSTTILGNITVGAEYDLEFVRHFTRMACFDDVVANLPKGYDSSIKEKGVNLSGGQQQRLALSRALLACHDKDIVLLDEPTSSLDAETEMHVYQNIFREFTGKTIISSIHRLHLLPLFDRICVFEEGKVIADGSLDSVLATCPTFRTQWETVQRLTVEAA